jgi:hypothetical protein
MLVANRWSLQAGKRHDRRSRLDLDHKLIADLDHIEHDEPGRAEPAPTTTFTHRGASLPRTVKQSRDLWGSPSHRRTLTRPPLPASTRRAGIRRQAQQPAQRARRSMGSRVLFTD